MKNVNITNCNVGQVGDTKGGSVTIYMEAPQQNISAFVPELETLLAVASEEQKQPLRDAVQAANKNDENTFITALKKVASIGENIFTRVAANAFSSYLRANGVI